VQGAGCLPRSLLDRSVDVSMVTMTGQVADLGSVRLVSGTSPAEVSSRQAGVLYGAPVLGGTALGRRGRRRPARRSLGLLGARRPIGTSVHRVAPTAARLSPRFMGRTRIARWWAGRSPAHCWLSHCAPWFLAAGRGW